MVAQVIKLPTLDTSYVQPRQADKTVDAVKSSAENIQIENTRAKKVAEQIMQSNQAVRNAVKVLNDFAEQIQTNLSFSIDEGSGRSVITVVDTQTGDVIRQIPAKEALAVANLIRESTVSNLDKVGLLLAEQG